MKKQLQNKEQSNRPDQPEYKDQPLPDAQSTKGQSEENSFKVGKTVKSFKDMYMPLNLQIICILSLSLLSFGSLARADGYRGERIRHGHYSHRHHDGRWYDRDEVIVPSAPVVQLNIR